MKSQADFKGHSQNDDIKCGPVPFPPFLNISWLRANYRLTPAEQRMLLDFLREVEFDVPDQRLSEDEFYEFFLSACSDFAFLRLVKSFFEGKGQTKRGRARTIDIAIFLKIAYDYDSRGYTLGSPKSPGSRKTVSELPAICDRLAVDGEWDYLAEFVWATARLGLDNDFISDFVSKHDPLARRLGSYADFIRKEDIDIYDPKDILSTLGVDLNVVPVDVLQSIVEIIRGTVESDDFDSHSRADLDRLEEGARALLAAIEIIRFTVDEEDIRGEERKAQAESLEKLRNSIASAIAAAPLSEEAAPYRAVLEECKAKIDAITLPDRFFDRPADMIADAATDATKAEAIEVRLSTRLSEAKTIAQHKSLMNESAADIASMEGLYASAVAGVGNAIAYIDRGITETNQEGATDLPDAKTDDTISEAPRETAHEPGSPLLAPEPTDEEIIPLSSEDRSEIVATPGVEPDAQGITAIEGDAVRRESDSQETAEPIEGVFTQEPDRTDPNLEGRIAGRILPAFEAFMSRKRFGFAYHLLRGAGCILDPDSLPMSSYAMAIFAVGRSLTSRAQPAAMKISSLIEDNHDSIRVIEPDQSRHDRLDTLAIFAGLVRPALFAPETGAEVILKTLPLGSSLQFLNEIRETICGTIHIIGGLTPTMLRSIDDSEWDRRKSAFNDDIAHRLSDLRKLNHRSFRYQPAWAIWDTMSAADGEIGLPMRLIEKGPESKAIEAAKTLLASIASQNPNDVIRRKDSELRGNHAKRVEDFARRKLISAFEEAYSIARDYLAFMETAPQGIQAHSRQGIEPLRSKLQRHAVEIAVQIDDDDVSTDSILHRTIEKDLLMLLDGHDVTDQPISWQHALHGDLLLLSGLRFSGSWEPIGSNPEALSETLILSILDAAETEDPDDIEAVFMQRCEESAHIASARLLSIMKRQGVPAKRIADLSTIRQQSILAAREGIIRRIGEVRKAIDQAMATDVLRDINPNNLLLQLESINITEIPAEDMIAGGDYEVAPEQTTGETIADFPSAIHVLDQAMAAIEKARTVMAENLNHELEGVSAKIVGRDADVGRIRDMIASGLFVAATEYIERLRENKPIPETEILNTAFASFFPGFIELAIDTSGKKTVSIDDVLRGLASGTDVGPLKLGAIEEDRRQDAADMLSAWKKLKNPSGDMAKHLQRLFSRIGFAGVVATLVIDSFKANRSQKYDMDCNTIASRDICRIPQFGSVAEGRYTVILWRGNASPEEIVQDLVPGTPSRPQIVLFLGSMSVARRRDFLRKARHERKNCLLIDEPLMLFLAQQQTFRLPALFDCTLPFTVVDPYVPFGDSIPPEIFFGRRDEIQKILDRFGSSFIYGGRQLGKSVLLDYIDRTYGGAAPGRVIKKIAIKPVGKEEPLDAIWGKISETLIEPGIMKARTTMASRVTEEIKNWLKTDADRSLFLLLDECDNFFEAETKSGFRNLETFKSLIEGLDRRVRIVFAGLHNVQRSSTAPNTPLGNYADPICIGPLYGHDTAEGVKLVTEPLAALGFEFDTPDLPLNILAQTNYYPSLAQLYCAELLKHLRAETRASDECPPHKITAEMVDNAFKNRDLRDQIASRFQLTLDLDPRYTVIALAMTCETLENMKAGRLSDSFTSAWIYRRVQDFWPQGFEGDNLQRFIVLLDEMVGLGVLARDDHGYRLRSINIARMMGDTEKIETELLMFENREPDDKFDIQSFRRSIKSGKKLMRSPLTPRQEYDILNREYRVGIVFGSEALGIDDVSHFLRSADSRVGISEKGAFPQSESLIAHLSRKPETGTSSQIVIVPTASPWTPEWIDRCLHNRPFMRNAAVSVLFLGGPEQAYEWIKAGRPGYGSPKKTFITALRPWPARTIEMWARDANLDPLINRDAVGFIANISGGMTRLMTDIETKRSAIPSDWKGHLNEWARHAAAEAGFAGRIGILEAVRPFLVAFADCGGRMSLKDVEDLPDVTGVPLPMPAKDVIEWGEASGVLIAEPGEQWHINPLVATLLHNDSIGDGSA